MIINIDVLQQVIRIRIMICYTAGRNGEQGVIIAIIGILRFNAVCI